MHFGIACGNVGEIRNKYWSKNAHFVETCQFWHLQDLYGACRPVDPHGRENLIAVADEIMSSISRVPAGNQYRINVEKWFSYMKKVATDTSDIRKIEDEIAVGQIEEILSMAKDELDLIDMYVENKGWEMVAEEQARADMVIDKMRDTIYFSNPAPPAEEIAEGEMKK